MRNFADLSYYEAMMQLDEDEWQQFLRTFDDPEGDDEE